MRWLLFATCFFFVLLASFWTYVWKFRVEFVQNGLERACPHYAVSLGNVEILSRTTWIIRHLSLTEVLSQDKPSILISEACLSAPTTSWIQWFLLPSRAPLFVEHATITFSKVSPFVLQTPQLYTGLHIATVTIMWPDGTSSTLKDVQGSSSEVLNQILNAYACTQHRPDLDKI